MSRRIGLALRPVVPSKEILNIAIEAERSGFESLWITESTSREAIALLGSLAIRTTKMKIGTGIINVYSRRPTTIAMAAGTIDELSHGRMILGLGASTPSIVSRWGGCRFEDQVQTVRECMEVVRLALRGLPFSYQGKVFNYSDVKLGFRPLRSEIPIYIAALNPKMTQLCGELAAGCLPNLIPPDYVGELRENLKIGLEKSRSNMKVEIASFILTSLSDDSTRAFETCREAILGYFSQPSYNRMLANSGFPEEALRIESSKAGDRREAIKQIPDRLVEALTASGTPKEVKAKINRYRSAGVDLPIIFPTMIRPDEPSYLQSCLKELVDAVPLSPIDV